MCWIRCRCPHAVRSGATPRTSTHRPAISASDPYEPYAIAAVELSAEGIIVLGKVVTGTGAADLRVGQAMELALEPLYTDDEGVERLVYAWKKVSA